MRAILLGVFLTLSASGCASVPMASTAEDAAGKQFSAPSPEKSALYIYRQGIFGGAVALTVSSGQRMLGSLAPDTWFRIDVDPGSYDVRCYAGEGSDSKIVQIGPGETRYVEAAMRMGFWAARCAVFEVNAEQGRSAVAAGHRAAEVR